jgi:hypothetical protein
LFRLYHISFIFAGVPKLRDLEPAFADTGDDWIRISSTTWIIWTSKTPAEIFNRIKPLLDNGDSFFVSDIDAGYCFGVLQPWIWNWINSKKPGSVVTGEAVTLHLPPPPR